MTEEEERDPSECRVCHCTTHLPYGMEETDICHPCEIEVLTARVALLEATQVHVATFDVPSSSTAVVALSPERYEIMRARVAQLEGELAAARADTERLDWLEAQARGYGRGWIFRESTSGRGMRLHETTRVGASLTARFAIDAAREPQP